MPTITEINGETLEPHYEARTQREIPAVVKGVLALPEQELDFVSLIGFLKDARFIDTNLYRLLLRRVPEISGRPRERMLIFIWDLLKITRMSVQQVAKCLFMYDFRFAQCALQMLFPGSGSGLHLEIETQSLPNESVRIRLFVNLKGQLDSNVIGDKASLLSRIAKIERKKVLNSAGVEQQLALDRYVIITCLRVQQYSNDRDKIQLLDQMNAIIPRNVDRTFASTLYHCKMGRVKRDQLHLQEALALSRTCRDQCLLALVAIDGMHVVRESFAEDGNQSHIDEIIKQCASGLGCADDTNVFLKRILYLNVVLTLLGINDRLRVNGHAYISPGNRTCARRILFQIKEHMFTSIEPRRNMMYCLAMARAFDNDDIVQARAFVEDAKRLAGENAFFDVEKRNIDEYLNYLNAMEDLNLPQPALTEN